MVSRPVSRRHSLGKGENTAGLCQNRWPCWTQRLVQMRGEEADSPVRTARSPQESRRRRGWACSSRPPPASARASLPPQAARRSRQGRHRWATAERLVAACGSHRLLEFYSGRVHRVSATPRLTLLARVFTTHRRRRSAAVAKRVQQIGRSIGRRPALAGAALNCCPSSDSPSAPNLGALPIPALA